MLGGESIKYIASILTIIRIICSVFLLFLFPLSKPFFICYIFCGITDVLDGWVARKTQTESNLGALLDSFSDIIFCGIVIIKLIPIVLVKTSIFLLIAGIIIGFIRISAYVIGWYRYCKFTVLHTRLNKLAGILLFFLPFIMLYERGLELWIICLICGLSAIEELIIEIKSKTYNPNIRGLSDLTIT